MSRNCFPIIPFILIIAAILVTGILIVMRVKHLNSDNLAAKSGSGLLLGFLLLGVISLATFLVYSLGNIFPC